MCTNTSIGIDCTLFLLFFNQYCILTFHFTARKILEQILNAVYYWHQKGIIHRDLKLENVLFSDIETLEIKVVDFGIAGYIRNNIGEDTDFGTVRYMAPEVLSNKDKKASRAIDIWAWGVILYTMLWNKFPFSGKNKCKLDFLLYVTSYDLNKQIYEQFLIKLDICFYISIWWILIDDLLKCISRPLKFPYLTLGKAISSEAEDLILKMLNTNPNERISMIDCFEHQWFRMSESQIEDSAKLNYEVTLKQEEERKEAKINK